MAGTRAAIRYAKAVLSLASDKKSADAINNDMKQIVVAMATSDDLNVMLQNPVVKPSTKKDILLSVFKNLNTITVNLIDILITNKRLSLLGEVALKVNQLYDKLKGKEVALVTTAIPLTNELKSKVLAKAKELTGNDVEVKNRVDENIIGGFILRIGDIQYNASIANKLNKLKREFILN
jgi:F-type H+-transporting ATPase subunit delta